jgi:hypothetical protein
LTRTYRACLLCAGKLVGQEYDKAGLVMAPAGPASLKEAAEAISA